MGKNVVKLNESQLTQIIAESVKRVLKESEYTDDYIAYQERMNRPISNEEWIKRVGSWSDRIKFELGLIDKLGVAAKYPSTTEEIDALATKAQKMYDYYTDPKRASEWSCEVRARALKKVIQDCEDIIKNPEKYIEKQRSVADKEYDKKVAPLVTQDKREQLRFYKFPKDNDNSYKPTPSYKSPEEISAMVDFNNKPMFPHNLEVDEQKSIHIKPEIKVSSMLQKNAQENQLKNLHILKIRLQENVLYLLRTLKSGIRNNK